MRDYYWKAVMPDADKHTARRSRGGGRLLHPRRLAPGGRRQTCLMLKASPSRRPSTMIIVEKERRWKWSRMLHQQGSARCTLASRVHIKKGSAAFTMIPTGPSRSVCDLGRWSQAEDRHQQLRR
jgi:hypothetical protein